MTREQIINILAEAGIDTATTKSAVSNLLSAFNEEKRNAVIESANKALEDFKDWKSPEEYKELEDNFTAFKDTTAKEGRKHTYKSKNIKDKWVDFVDEKLKDSKDFDKDLEAFLKDNPELCDAPTSQTTSKASFSSLGNSGSETSSSPNATINAFIRGKAN